MGGPRVCEQVRGGRIFRPFFTREAQSKRRSWTVSRCWRPASARCARPLRSSAAVPWQIDVWAPLFFWIFLLFYVFFFRSSPCRSFALALCHFVTLGNATQRGAEEENERKWRHKFVKLFRDSFPHAHRRAQCLIGCRNSRVPWRRLTLSKAQDSERETERERSGLLEEEEMAPRGKMMGSKITMGISLLLPVFFFYFFCCRSAAAGASALSEVATSSLVRAAIKVSNESQQWKSSP